MILIINRYLKSWYSTLKYQSVVKEILITLCFALYVFTIFPRVLQYCEQMEGIQLNDFILNLFIPYDFSNWIFFVEYICVLLALVNIMKYPLDFVRAIQAYCLLLLFRMGVIYLIPLEPPVDMIYLKDPITSFCLETDDLKITRDLFFSGHVSTLYFLFLWEKNKFIKSLLLISTITVGVMLMWQRVHYSIDVIFAPVGAWLCYKAVPILHRIRVNLFRNSNIA